VHNGEWELRLAFDGAFLLVPAQGFDETLDLQRPE